MMNAINYSDDEDEDSFVVLDENPEDSIGQMSLVSLTMDQAVYTIGTLTQRVEQLTEALQRSGGTVPRSSHPTIETINGTLSPSLNVRRVVSSTQTDVNQTVPTADSCSQAEVSRAMAAVQAQVTSTDGFQQTEEMEEDPFALSPPNIRDKVSDLQTAMQRLSAEKMSCLTTISDRERRISRLKEELSSTKLHQQSMEETVVQENARLEKENKMLQEVLADKAQHIETMQFDIDRLDRTVASDQEVQRHQKAQIDQLSEEVISLRLAAQMFQDDARAGMSPPVMVDRHDGSAVPVVSYPFDTVPSTQRHH